MHLAIAALGQGTPVFCFAYQGKFAGLYNHFSLNNDYIVSPSDIDSPAELESMLSKFLEHLTEEKTVISEHLPHVLALAKKNLI